MVRESWERGGGEEGERVCKKEGGKRRRVNSREFAISVADVCSGDFCPTCEALLLSL